MKARAHVDSACRTSRLIQYFSQVFADLPDSNTSPSFVLSVHLWRFVCNWHGAIYRSHMYTYYFCVQCRRLHLLIMKSWCGMMSSPRKLWVLSCVAFCTLECHRDPSHICTAVLFRVCETECFGAAAYHVFSVRFLHSYVYHWVTFIHTFIHGSATKLFVCSSQQSILWEVCI